MGKIKTNEEFLNEMHEKHPKIKVKGLYIRSVKKKIYKKNLLRRVIVLFYFYTHF